MYNEYKVSLQIRERICGGIPKDLETIKGWLESRGVLPKESAKRAADIKAEIGNDEYVEQETAKAWTTFKQDQYGVYIEPRQIRAMIKESSFVLEITKEVRGLRQRLQHGLVIKPDRIYLTRNGETVAKPDGFEEKPIHVMGPMGPRTALKRHDFVLAPKLDFTIRIALPDGKDKTQYLTEERLKAILEWAQDGIGLGASRSQDEGKFDILEFVKLQ